MVSTLVASAPAAPGPFDAAWRRFHAAGDPVLRQVAWAQLQQAGWSGDFDATLDQLRTRKFSANVPTGHIRGSRTDLAGRTYRYSALIPDSYDPQRAYPLRVMLHGSTRRPQWGTEEDHWRWLRPFRSSEVITVFPAAWNEAMWWTQSQVDNLAAILDELRARYHIDPDRCTLTGLSDGGTGTFYHALRAPTPWAAFLPLIGHPWVLGNPQEGVDGDLFAANLQGRALFVVNGAEDRLYPARALEPYLDLFTRAGASVRFLTKPGGHTIRWWPEEAAAFEEFCAGHPRDPFPDTLVWETDDPRRNGRCGWLKIDALGDSLDSVLDPLNTVLFPKLDPPTRAEAFPRHGPSGRVSLRRDGNTVHIQTRNVRQVTLLLGVGEFRFDQPITIVLNGRVSSRIVQPSVETLMEWAIHDGDGTMLVAASLTLHVDH